MAKETSKGKKVSSKTSEKKTTTKKATNKDNQNCSKLIMIGTGILVILVVCFLLYEYLGY